MSIAAVCSLAVSLSFLRSLSLSWATRKKDAERQRGSNRDDELGARTRKREYNCGDEKKRVKRKRNLGDRLALTYNMYVRMAVCVCTCIVYIHILYTEERRDGVRARSGGTKVKALLTQKWRCTRKVPKVAAMSERWLLRRKNWTDFFFVCCAFWTRNCSERTKRFVRKFLMNEIVSFLFVQLKFEHIFMHNVIF